MTTSSVSLDAVLGALGYKGAEGLVTEASSDVAPGRLYVWHEVREKLGLDGAYFHGNVPLVYFKECDTVDDSQLLELHKSLWNHNRVPLLIAVTPSDVRVYNCFAPPVAPASGQLALSEDGAAVLLRAVTFTADVLDLRRALGRYGRREVESGRFADGQASAFAQEKRVDHRLLQNLATLRRQLINDGLQEQLVNSLLGRAIFVRYLEDRGVIGPDFFGRFHSASSFRDLLRTSRAATYHLFDELARRFNGDLFPVEASERRTVRAAHLQRLGRFLAGDEVGSGQMYFWAYDFRYIPIELISAIYETFLKGVQEKTGAYYTPPQVVEFVLNELLPVDDANERIRVLDPACGSGIFLVEAYRRLVLKRQRSLGRSLRYSELRDLLTSSIDGVDVSADAISVASFSCCLALLDFLEPKSIWEDVVFPKLKDKNLFVADFFDTQAPFNRRRYSLIVGNPPWQSRLSEHAQSYLSESKRSVGDQQLAQAFLWRAPDLLASDGAICLLAPSKAVLYNQSNPNKLFRRDFFASYRVTSLVDFSLFRKGLFRNAIAPMVAVYYRHSPAQPQDRIIYYAPRPSPLSNSVVGIVVSGDEVTRVSNRWAIEKSDLWKSALWGTARDATLISDLRERFSTLGDFADQRGWSIHEGVQVAGGDKNRAPSLAAMRYVPAEAIKPFRVESDSRLRIGTDVFHRPRNPEMFLGPHVLLRGGVLSGGIIAAAYLDGSAVFRDTVIGLSAPRGDADLLRAVCAILNSSIARYYHLLTSSTWAIERDVIRLQEHRQLPVALPLDRERLDALAKLADDLENGESHDSANEVDNLVFDLYELTAIERDLVRDKVTSSLSQFYEGTGSAAFARPSSDDLHHYALAYTTIFQANTGRSLSPTLYTGDSAYCIASFRLGASGEPVSIATVASNGELDQQLTRLEDLAMNSRAGNLYFRRNIKVFESDVVHIVKPAERRFWTRTAAFNDADATVAELLTTAQVATLR